jgi:hypothetical protein
MTKAGRTYRVFFDAKPTPNKFNRFKTKGASKKEQKYSQNLRRRKNFKF